jgi:hypothetical protein
MTIRRNDVHSRAENALSLTPHLAEGEQAHVWFNVDVQVNVTLRGGGDEDHVQVEAGSSDQPSERLKAPLPLIRRRRQDANRNNAASRIALHKQFARLAGPA